LDITSSFDQDTEELGNYFEADFSGEEELRTKSI